MSADDDIYLRDGESYQAPGVYYPEAPEEQKAAEQDIRNIKAASYPILEDNLKWFEEAINACDNMDNIVTADMTRNGVTYSRRVSVEAQVLAYQLLKAKLQEKYAEYQEFAKEIDS